MRARKRAGGRSKIINISSVHRRSRGGVDERAYPEDVAVCARYHPALRRIDGCWPMPPPLSWEQVEVLLEETGAPRRAGVRTIDASGV